MFKNMFGHINLMEKSLDTLWLRQDVIAHNIANADTPDYKAQHVEFETMFKAAIENPDGFQMKTSSARHITATSSNPLDVMPVVVSEDWRTQRMDGNSVDVDQEMTELAENTILYNTTIQKVSDEFARLKLAITGS